VDVTSVGGMGVCVATLCLWGHQGVVMLAGGPWVLAGALV
jgi:hypothetical protein